MAGPRASTNSSASDGFGLAAGNVPRDKIRDAAAPAASAAPAWGLVAMLAVAAWTLLVAWLPGDRPRPSLTGDRSAGPRSARAGAPRQSPLLNSDDETAARASSAGGAGADQRAEGSVGLTSAGGDALCEQPGGALRPRQAGTEESPGRSKFNRQLAVGDPAPVFESLPGIDGLPHSLSEWRDHDVLVVMFVRSLCPTTHAHEERLRQFAAGLDRDRVALVAISVSQNPAEGLDKMTRRAEKQQYRWPWLCDLSQRTAREFGATVTPQFFVLDRERRVAYMGAFDNDPTGKRVTRPHVADAVAALLRGEAPPVRETLARGCDIELAEEQPPASTPAPR
ncbi:MAG: redoxin domain-containing protein [Planctomycetaceae bacterium]